jgi:hypothetical protein
MYNVRFISFSFSLALESGLKRLSSKFERSQQQQTAPAYCFALTMKRLFSPCTRYRDILESQGRLGPREWLQELNFDVSTEELLSADRAFTYADLYAILRNRRTVLWLAPHAIVVPTGGLIYDAFCHYVG